MNKHGEGKINWNFDKSMSRMKATGKNKHQADFLKLNLVPLQFNSWK